MWNQIQCSIKTMKGRKGVEDKSQNEEKKATSKRQLV